MRFRICSLIQTYCFAAPSNSASVGVSQIIKSNALPMWLTSYLHICNIGTKTDSNCLSTFPLLYDSKGALLICSSVTHKHGVLKFLGVWKMIHIISMHYRKVGNIWLIYTVQFWRSNASCWAFVLWVFQLQWSQDSQTYPVSCWDGVTDGLQVFQQSTLTNVGQIINFSQNVALPA